MRFFLAPGAATTRTKSLRALSSVAAITGSSAFPTILLCVSIGLRMSAGASLTAVTSFLIVEIVRFTSPRSIALMFWCVIPVTLATSSNVIPHLSRATLRFLPNNFCRLPEQISSVGTFCGPRRLGAKSIGTRGGLAIGKTPVCYALISNSNRRKSFRPANNLALLQGMKLLYMVYWPEIVRPFTHR